MELLQYLPLSQAEGAPPEEEAAGQSDMNQGTQGGQSFQRENNGGVEDDSFPNRPRRSKPGLIRTAEELVGPGSFQRSAHRCAAVMKKSWKRPPGNSNYSLVVIGDMFLSKGHSTRTRQTRELTLAIRDRLKAPVIMAD